jgi:hypothetical protein
MEVNKNIDELKKELENMHKLFDNVLFEKKTSINNTKTLFTEKEEIKKQAQKESTNNNFDDNTKEITSGKDASNNSEIIKPKTEVLNQDNDINIIDKTKTDIDDIKNDAIMYPEPANEPNLTEIPISFDNTKKSDTKVINLNKKEQYLSIREKLEKIKNEIKKKESELKNKNK